MNRNIEIYDNECEMAKRGISIILEELSRKEKISVAFSGGKTPILFFKLLAKEKVDWKRIHVFLVDERLDPKGIDTLKNLITENLLSQIDIPKENINLIDYYDSIDIVKDSYNQKLFNYFKENIKFDIIFLGVGDDGHTASLFEDSDIFLGGNLAITSSIRHQHSRLSLTMEVLNNSNRKIFMFGPKKIPLLDEIIKKRLPASRVENPEIISFKK